MKRYDAVVFDWDGTLMDSTHHIVSALQRACTDLNLPVPSAQEAAWVIGMSLEGALYRLVPDLGPEQMQAFVQRYRDHYLHGEAEPPLFEGMADFLAELHSGGVILGVATGKSRRGLDRAIRTLSLQNVFRATRCADEAAGKPDPTMLHQLLQEFSMTPEQILMVGDTTHDIWMARNAGVDSLAVSYGAHPRSELDQAEPTALVSSGVAMRDWVRARVL
ncbi:MAG: HAD-IA family hydrolase [Alcaligenaceae bacterium]|nr:HAD-IA family hydrolase [Alcaligenaceae bacterium]